jgi:uncharacterized phage infection (PIP) family protein YhgE
MLRYAILAIVLASASGCNGKPSAAATGTGLPAAVATTREAAKAVQAAAAKIETANTEVAKVPDLADQATTIAAGVAELRTTGGTLEATSVTLGADAKKVAELQDQLAAAQKQVADLKANKDSWLSRLLGIAAVAGLGLAVVSMVWLRNGQGALTGIAVFGAAIAGQWILEYRIVIGMAALGLAAAWVVYALLRERKAASEVVRLVETFKPRLDAESFKTVANAIQSKSTKRVVDAIQRTLGINKGTAA